MENTLKIGIVGFGNFGQFLAKAMIKQGHSVIATSRSDYGEIAHRLGILFFRDQHEFCRELPDVILLCTSILSTESTLRAFPLQGLNPNTLFVDALSVKEFPRNLLLEVLPPEYEILCTHPMFGPQSGKESWAGLPFVYDKVRISKAGTGAQRCRDFLRIFETQGCRMVEMSCAEHDRYAARSQFVTHAVGRVLSNLNLEPTPIDTKSYETLLSLLEKLECAFATVKRDLLSRLPGRVSSSSAAAAPESSADHGVGSFKEGGDPQFDREHVAEGANRT